MKDLATAVEVVEIDIAVEPRRAHLERGFFADIGFIDARGKGERWRIATDSNGERLEQAGDIAMRPRHQADGEVERRDTRDRRGLSTQPIEILVRRDMTREAGRAVRTQRVVYRGAGIALRRRDDAGPQLFGSRC